MSSHVCMLFLVTIMIAMDVKLGYCRTVPTVPEIPTEIPKNSTPCSIEVDEMCSYLEEDPGNYSMELTVDSFRDKGEVQVKISMTQCPWHATLSPWWYQLEVMKGTSTGTARQGQADVASDTPIFDEGQDVAPKLTSEEGTFQVVKHNGEIQLCNNQSTVVFTSCSATPLDFPVSFYWKASKHFEESASICFRLTLKHDGETSCKWKEVCHSIADMPNNPTNTSDSLGGQIETVLEGLNYTNVLDGTAFETDHASANHVYDDVRDFLNNRKVTDIPNEGGCSIIQKFLGESHSAWIPACDCHGYYKKVQCDRAAGNQHTCWCSTRGGSEKAFTRMTLNCNNFFKFKC